MHPPNARAEGPAAQDERMVCVIPTWKPAVRWIRSPEARGGWLPSDRRGPAAAYVTTPAFEEAGEALEVRFVGVWPNLLDAVGPRTLRWLE